jgi:hypothetical protein
MFFAGFIAPGFAHDPGHPELNSWFDNLRSSKGLCCSFADGFAVSDVDWESKGGHLRVRLEDNWIDVPNDALITEPNRVERTMVSADINDRASYSDDSRVKPEMSWCSATGDGTTA